METRITMTISPSAKQAAETWIGGDTARRKERILALSEIIQALLDSELAASKATAAEHDDFMSFMATELAKLPCCHEAGEHTSTPPMMWPELIACISKKAAETATVELRATISGLREERDAFNADAGRLRVSFAASEVKLAAAEKGKLALHVKLIDLLHKHGTGETNDCDGEKIVEMVERIVAEKLAAEKERDEAKSKLSKLGRLIDFAQANNDASTEQEVALSASFNEAMAHENMRIIEAERDAALAALEEIANRVTGISYNYVIDNMRTIALAALNPKGAE